MARSINTIQVVGPAGKVIIDDTSAKRQAYHAKGYTYQCGSPLVPNDEVPNDEVPNDEVVEPEDVAESDEDAEFEEGTNADKDLS